MHVDLASFQTVRDRNEQVDPDHRPHLRAHDPGLCQRHGAVSIFCFQAVCWSYTAQTLSSFWEQVMKLKDLNALPGMFIMRKGDIGAEMFFLLKGPPPIFLLP